MPESLHRSGEASTSSIRRIHKTEPGHRIKQAGASPPGAPSTGNPYGASSAGRCNPAGLSNHVCMTSHNFIPHEVYMIFSVCDTVSIILNDWDLQSCRSGKSEFAVIFFVFFCNK
jgi:hypothetical protein